MVLKKILFFITIIYPVFSKNFGSWEDNVDINPELRLLFDNEENSNIKIEKPKNTICDTKQCQIIADDFKRGMNKSVDPCNDFYDYVCGNWISHNPIPSYQFGWGRVHQFQEIVYSRIKGILESEAVPSDILPVRQAKKWYRSCMDTEVLDRKGLRPLESILLQIGGWPMTMDPEEWDESDYTWQSVEEHYFHITGSYVFYDVLPQYGNKSGVKLTSERLPLHGEIELKHRNYVTNDYNSYMKLMEGIIKIFVDEHKSDVSMRMIVKDVEDVIEFEKKLFLLNSVHTKSNKTNIDEFIKMYKEQITEIEVKDNEIQMIDFRRMIRRVFDMVNNDIEDSTSLILFNNIEYWVELTKILNETPKRTIVNYIHWYFVSTMMKYTTESIRELIFKMQSDDYGITARKPRWLECIHEVKMGVAKSYAFIQEYFHDHTEADVREMIDHIRDEMKSQIEKVNWLNEESKKLSIEKLMAMKVFVGYPEWFKNKSMVLNSYNGLTIGNDHFHNVLSYEKYEKRRALKKLSSDSTIDPTFINAFYMPGENSIELPAADFQPPLFTAKLPRHINYGMAGVIIGHEIGHGFDDQGIKYDKDGEETKIAKHMMDMYYQRADCFRDQFNEYWSVTEGDYDESTPDYLEQAPGRRTQPENIADTTGLHAVFEAYKKIVENLENGDNKLPGFEEYTDNQMFFISYAALHCEKIRPKIAAEMDKFNSHSPSRLRVIGPVSNIDDFARAFNCPKGSPMNPNDKCNIWKSSSKKSSNIAEESEMPLFYRWHY